MSCLITSRTGTTVTAAPGFQTWGPELLGFCQQNNLLILNGRTPGNECGHFTFQSAGRHSSVDYFVASVKCMTAAKSLLTALTPLNKCT